MAKPKFVLTSDLVKVEPEPVLVQAVTPSFEKEVTAANADPVPFTPPITPFENREGEGVKSADKKSLPVENAMSPQRQPVYDSQPKMSDQDPYTSKPSNHTPVSQSPNAYNSPEVLRSPPIEASFEASHKTPPVSLRESSLFLRMREANQPSVVRDQFNLKIDRDLKRDFRLWCLLREISMTEALEDAIRFYMEKIDRMER